MQMTYRVPILQPAADKTVGNPVSTEEKSAVKAAVSDTLWRPQVGCWSTTDLPEHTGHSRLGLAVDNCSRHCLLHRFETTKCQKKEETDKLSGHRGKKLGSAP